MEMLAPLPPINIQQQIVNILDQYEQATNNITAALTKETELRKKQYKYYRDHLLRYNPNPTHNGLKPYELGDELSGCNGTTCYPLYELTLWEKRYKVCPNEWQPTTHKAKALLAAEVKAMATEGGNVKLLTTSETNLYTTEEIAGDAMIDGEIVCIPWGGNPVVQYYKGKYVTADNKIAIARDPNKLDMRYLYYHLQSRLDEIKLYYRGPVIAHPDMSRILAMEIPLPPLEIQKQIADVLDKFEQYTNEITGLLPKEIKLRQKQYKYYRDLLLDFEPLD